MPHRHRLFVLAVAAAVTLFAGPGPALALTDDELLQLFQTQRDAFKAARESGNGQTRGLTLVTVEDVAVDATAPTLNQPDTTDTGATVSAATDDTVAGASGPTELQSPGIDAAAAAGTEPARTDVVFGDLAPEFQVNVNIRFGFDSAALADDQKPLLAQLCTVMKASDINLFRVVGHTDASGTDEYNEQLSRLRANEVKRYLVTDCGIAATRLEAIGLGERFLSNDGDPRAPENRRVEFQAMS